MNQNLSKLTDLALEQYRLNELPRAEAERVQRLLGTDASLRGRLAVLAQSDEEISREYPPAWLASQIRTRAAAQGTVAPRRRPVMWWGWPLALGTTVVVLLFTLPAGVMNLNHSTGVSTAEDSRPKGVQPALTVYRRTDRGSETMADGAIARAGDLLRLGYAAVGQAYGVILSVDGRGTVTRHLPAH